MLLVCIMLNVPLWLLQPGVWPVSVKVPFPEPMPIAMVPFIVSVLVDMLPGAVQDMVMFTVPPSIIPGPIWPLKTVPVPKHDPRLPMLLKFMLLPLNWVLFCIMSNENEPNCWPDALAMVADHVPVAGFAATGCDEELLLPPQAAKPIASAIAAKALTYLMGPPRGSSKLRSPDADARLNTGDVREDERVSRTGILYNWGDQVPELLRFSWISTDRGKTIPRSWFQLPRHGEPECDHVMARIWL